MSVTFARSFALTLLSAFALSACTTGWNAALQSARHFTSRSSPADQAKLDPSLTYLRITLAGRTSLLWLGTTEPHKNGVVEVYYAGSGQVFRLQNGRVVGVSGLPTEWRDVEIVQAPSWSAAATARGPVSVVRVRDVMPGYRLGVRDQLVLEPIEPPTRNALAVLDAGRLRWFEERFQASANRVGALVAGLAGGELLPPARYAVAFDRGAESVVYGEQCLAKDVCFTWQRWSAAMQERSAGRN